jgi:hypothetical protein
MLSFLPSLPDHADYSERFVSFSNPGDFKQKHGFAEDAILKDVPQDRLNEFLDIAGVMCPSVGRLVREAERPQMVMVIGYDVMAVRRCIDGSGVIVVEGNFDTSHIATSLESLGYDTDEVNGFSTYHFNPESFTDEIEEARFAAQAGNIAVVDGLVFTASTKEQLRMALDTWQGQLDNLGNDPQYAAVANALGPVHQAIIYQRENENHQLVGIGYQEISEEKRATRLVLTYSNMEEAKKGREQMTDKLKTHEFTHKWDVSKLTLIEDEKGPLLIITLRLKDWVPSGIVLYPWDL